MAMDLGSKGSLKADINVTPLVDVMLVLLIIFMVAAPLMTVGVPVDLPKTQARALNQENEPITISVNPEGKPALHVHGGPGGGLNTGYRRMFDPEKCLIVGFEQRGCGRSAAAR